MAEKKKREINKVSQDILFKGGMNKDISKFHTKEDGYYDAQNFRLGSSEFSGIPDIETLKGNKLSLYIPAIFVLDHSNQVFPLTSAYTLSVVHTTTSNWSIGSATYASLNAFVVAIAAVVNADTLVENIAAHVDRSDNLIITSIQGDNITSVTASPVADATTAYETLKIVGKATVRDSIILHTTDSVETAPTTSYGQIWKLDYSDTTLTDSAPTPTIYLKYHDQLNFSLYNPIEARAYYERSDIIKDYWVDGYNYMRYANIEADDLWDLSPQQFDIVNNATFSNVEFVDLSPGGTYTCGMVSYCYQLFRRYGAQSVISPISGLIHLAPSNEGATTSENYKGGIQTDLAEKVINIKIDNLDTRFDGIKVIAIHYKDAATTPNINIIKEQDIPDGGYISISDTGLSLYQYSLEDFIAFGGRLFVPKTLEIKDRRIFPSNITEEYFDVNLDTRAYRFNSSNLTKIFDGDPTDNDYITVSPTGDVKVYTAGVWDNITIADWAVPETYDCYLPKGADPSATADDQYTYKYKLTNNTGTGTYERLGGTGKNVEYQFVLKQLLEDVNMDYRALYTTQGSQAWSSEISSEYSDSDGFQNYAGPINDAQLRGYQRDEAYRIGCIIRNTKGQRSFVKWIGDIKMPAVYELDLATVARPATYYFDYPTNTSVKLDYGIAFKTTVSDNVYSNILGMEFKIDLSSLSDVEGFEIVFVKRNDYDKTIVTQGFGSYVYPVTNYDATDYNVCRNSPLRFVDLTISFYTKQYLFLDTPDISFKKKFSDHSGSKLRLIGGYSNHADSYTSNNIDFSGTEYDATVKKLRHFLSLDNLSKDYGFIIDENKLIEPVGSIEVGGQTIYGLFSLAVDTWVESIKGSSGVISIDQTNAQVTTLYGNAPALTAGDSTMTTLKQNGYCVFNLERELTAQYGGYTYEERSANIYQSTGKYFNSGLTGFKSIFGGDTYVTYYDSLIAMPKVYEVTKTAPAQQWAIYMPLETTYNLTLRHDTCYSRLSPYLTYTLHETILDGVEIFGATYLPAATDLYQYNDAYSRGNDVLFFMPKPLYFENNVEYDTRILASNHKTDGENIDNWTVYPALNYKDAESTYGPINAMVFKDNKIICFQDYAVFIPSINDRSILKDSIGNDIVIGSSGLLERIDYMSTDYGCSDKTSIVIAPSGLYWVDVLSKTICVLRDKIIPLSSIHGMKEYLNQNVREVILTNSNPYIHIYDSVVYDGTAVISGYNSEFNEILFTFKNEIWNSVLAQYDKEYFTVTYNEMFEVFQSFFSINSPMYLNHNSKFFQIRTYYSYSYPAGLPDAPAGDYPDEIWLDGYGDYGSIFNETVASTISIVANKHPKYIKVADNMYIICESWDEDNYNQHDDFFDKIRCYNTYQNSGLLTFVVYDTFNEAKIPGQLFAARRGRKWMLAIPRNAIDENLVDMDTKDILSVAYLDQTRTFRERLKDRYHIIELTKNNTDNNRFTVQEMEVMMRLSFR